MIAPEAILTTTFENAKWLCNALLSVWVGLLCGLRELSLRLH
jgi:hypothetical protein